MATNGTALGPDKAHRVSRHVSFQAVVPPAVSFPVNYSRPSITNNHRMSLARQSIADSQISDSSPEEFKARAGRQMSTVINLDTSRDSTDTSACNSASPFIKLRNKFTFMNFPKKNTSCFFNSMCGNCKNLSQCNKKYLLIAAAFAACVILLIIIASVSVMASKRHASPQYLIKNNAYSSEICENPACLRIGLFFQTVLSELNTRGIENPCTDLENLVKLMWQGEEVSDFRFRSPLAAAVEQISKESQEVEKCIRNNESANSPAIQTGADINLQEKNLAKLLRDVTLTFNSFGKTTFL